MSTHTSKYKKYSTVLKALSESLNYVTPKHRQLGIIAMITIENKLDNYLDDRTAVAVGILVTKAKESLKENNIDDAKTYINSAMMVLSR